MLSSAMSPLPPRCQSAQELGKSLLHTDPYLLRKTFSAYSVRDEHEYSAAEAVPEEEHRIKRERQPDGEASCAFWHVFIGVMPNGRSRSSDEITLAAERFLKMYDVKDYLDIVPQSRGFSMTFRSKTAAELAMNNCEDGRFEDAWRRCAIARVVPYDSIPRIVEELETEVWIYPKCHQPCADQVEKLVEWWNQQRWCGGPKEMSDDPKMIWEIVLMPFHEEHDETKYVVKMRSSEIAIAAAFTPFPHSLAGSVEKIVVRTSPASQYKHRFDLQSLVFILPPCSGVHFDEKTFSAWTKPLDKIMDFRKFDPRIISSNIWQISTRNIEERNFIQRNLKMCGRYRNCPVSAVTWLEYIQFTQFNAALSESELKRLGLLIEGDPEELRKIKQEMDDLNRKRELPVADDGADVFYFDMAQSTLSQINISVGRSGNCAQNEKVQFFDLFLTTVDYYQTALKRMSTIDKFRYQMNDVVQDYGADGFTILNTYMSLDALNGVVFYIWFRNRQDHDRLREDVKKGKLFLRDVIQTMKDIKVATDAMSGSGFVAHFRAGERKTTMNLIEISKNVVWDYK